MTAHPLPDPAASAFAAQADACRDLGSPLVAAICSLVAERGLPDSATRRRIATWPGAIGAREAAVPLRFAAALHRLVLDAADDGLAAAFPPADLDRDVLWHALRAAVSAHDGFIAAYLDSPPQTNEVARAALLLPALLDLHAAHGLPIRLLELGASAGLNQNLDRFAYEYGAWQWGDPASPVLVACEWRGEAGPPEDRDIEIAERSACDVAPVPVGTEDEQRRLLSYAWADQRQRLARLSAAMKLAGAHPPQVEASGAADWLEDRLAPLPEGRLTVIMHTIMWQYLPNAERARAETAIRRAGRDAKPDRPLAWLRFEADGQSPGGGVYLTTWSGTADDGITGLVARGDYHGRWLQMLP